MSDVQQRVETDSIILDANTAVFGPASEQMSFIPVKESELLGGITLPVDTDDIDQILNKILIQRPYFRLNKIEDHTGSFRASVLREQPPVFEATSITSTEAARHMAILGCCAIASHVSKNDTQLYYCLAISAEMELLGLGVSQSYASEFSEYTISAENIVIDKHDATAFTKIFEDGVPLFQAKITYKLVPQRIFERLYKSHQNLLSSGSESPYNKLIIGKKIEMTEDSISIHFGPILPENCVGHFGEYPALPVAFLMGAFPYYSGIFLTHKLQKVAKIVVENAIMNVSELIFAGETLRIEIKLLSSENNVFVFSNVGIKNDISKIIDVEARLRIL